MIPNKSNTTNGCDNTSSNCVVWQGPDLTCVNVCNGDTISDILAKMCESIVSITSTSTGVDISTINQLCLEETYGVANNVQALIQNIITEVCKVHDHAGSDPCSCVIPLPTCLQYVEEGTGNTITQLPLYDSNTGVGYATVLANQICNNINAISQLQNTQVNHEARIVTLEQRPARERYVAPKVVPTFVGTPGRPVSLEKAVALTEEYVGELQRSTGAPSAISTALNVAPNYNDRDRLSGKGTMNAISQWNVSPSNMAQSFQNLWITMNDTRNAVQSIKETVASPLCKDVTLGVTGSVEKTNEGTFSKLMLDFTGSTIPTGYIPCDSRGTKLTITDSSLNTVVVYADVVNHLQNEGTFGITQNLMGNLDLGSNFSIRVDFCVSNGDNQCQEIYNFTVDNEMACPNLTIGTITSDSADFGIASIAIPANKGHVISVNLRSTAGTLIDSRSFTAFGSSIAGTFSNLSAATSYQMLIEITRSGSTKPIQCAIQTFATTAPSCSTELMQSGSTRWFTSATADTESVSGGNTLDIAAYNDGAGSLTKWTAGWNGKNQPIVMQDTSVTGIEGWSHQGEFINPELGTQTLVIDGFPLSPLATSTVVRANKDSGWKYIGALSSPVGLMMYVYAEVNSNTKAISGVVFSCNCSGLYLDTPQPVFTCEKNGSVLTTINAVGHSPASSDFQWTVSTQPTHGSLSTVGGYPTSTEQRYLYTHAGNNMAADSFIVSLTNDCGSVVSTKRVSILPSRKIKYTTSEIIVFFDTTIMTPAAATDIKTTFNSIISGFSGTKPNIYYVPVQGAWAGDYLKHVKGCVERINANQYWTGSQESITLATGGTWPAVASYPAWWSGSGKFYPPDIKVISFVNKMSTTSGLYATATTVPAIANWFGFGPTDSSWANPHQYEEDYACVSDLIDIPTSAQRTIWTSALQALPAIPWTDGAVPFTYDQVVIPIIEDAAGLTATAALQQFAALQGSSLMTSQEAGGTKFGLRQFAFDSFTTTGINVAGYLNKDITGTPIPYSGTKSVPAGGSITIQGLKDLTNSSTAVHAYIEGADDLDGSTNSKITTIFRGMLGLEATGSTGEPNSQGVGYMGGKGAEFGFSDVDKATACGNASGASAIQLFTAFGSNTPGGAGDPFSPAKGFRAYLTPVAAARNVAGVEELTHNRYYAIEPGTGGTSWTARYNNTGSPSFWTDILQC